MYGGEGGRGKKGEDSVGVERLGSLLFVLFCFSFHKETCGSASIIECSKFTPDLVSCAYVYAHRVGR